MHGLRSIPTAVLAGALLLTATACSSSNSDEKNAPTPSESTSAAPSPTPSETGDPLEAAILKVYRASWDAQEEAYAKADSKGTKLHDYMSLDALAQVESELMTMRKNGRVTTGEVTIDPEVASVDKDKKMPTAKVADCVDVSKWIPVDKETGKEASLPPDRLTKYVVNSDMSQWGDRWMVVKFTIEGKSC